MSLTNRKYCFGVLSNEVLDAYCCLVQKLKTIAAIDIIFLPTDHVHQLWHQPPHLGCNIAVFGCSVIDQKSHAMHTVFCHIHTIRSQTVHQNRIHNRLQLLHISFVILGCLNDSSQSCDAPYCCQCRLAIIVIKVHFD